MAESKKPAAPIAKAPTANPHTWLDLNPDPKHTPVDFMFGVLEPEYLGRTNSAVGFATAKVQPVPPRPGRPLITAAKVDVALPRDADDRYEDPLALAAEVDRQAVPGKALLAYLTLYFPAVQRLHHAWRAGFSFATALADEFDVAVIAALHAPHRAGSNNPVHLHLLIPPRRLDALGLGAYQSLLCYPRGQKALADKWDAHRQQRAC